MNIQYAYCEVPIDYRHEQVISLHFRELGRDELLDAYCIDINYSSRVAPEWRVVPITQGTYGIGGRIRWTYCDITAVYGSHTKVVLPTIGTLLLCFQSLHGTTV